MLRNQMSQPRRPAFSAVRDLLKGKTLDEGASGRERLLLRSLACDGVRRNIPRGRLNSDRVSGAGGMGAVTPRTSGLRIFYNFTALHRERGETSRCLDTRQKVGSLVQRRLGADRTRFSNAGQSESHENRSKSKVALCFSLASPGPPPAGRVMKAR
ncbi:hypothetical protein EVAR_36837_1 [Eumeta japonica]|uniref:Uncharacterized protein n=1 Tax=Eumeta variegata TaxID=151549 RepID=A0A4C1WBH7_EUMVA|nr:hypothetical protein EVAR_36837_1 [Eumeta japonica]